jgi:aldose sugar dehydrogenase
MGYRHRTAQAVHRSALARIGPEVCLLLALWPCGNSAAAIAVTAVAAAPLATSGAGAPRVAVLTSALSRPWGMAFLPDGRMLVTQKAGTLVVVSANGATVSAPFSTTLPKLVSIGQGGLLDVALDPDFDLATNPRIYWAFSESGVGGVGTAVARGKLVASGAGFAIESAQVIYRQVPKVQGISHFGARLVFRGDKTLFVTLGDRMQDDPANPTISYAQNLATTLGKVVRITRDGTVPAGNPKFAVADALPEIWSYGQRNPQGAAMKPGTDELWLTEHGPRGGDELNRVVPGRNYGWPLRSYGCPYSVANNVPGCWVGGGAHAPTFEEPKTTWLPNSTAPSDLMFYTGTRFTDLGWAGNAFTGGLAGGTLWRMVLSGNAVVSKEEVAVVKALGQRIRVVKQGPDGWIYLLTDAGQLVRIFR